MLKSFNQNNIVIMIMITIFYINSNVNIQLYHTIYAYIYEKEMKHYRIWNLEFQLVYQGFKNIVWFI